MLYMERGAERALNLCFPLKLNRAMTDAMNSSCRSKDLKIEIIVDIAIVMKIKKNSMPVFVDL